MYPGTSREVWVHVPAGYDASEPAALTVFQDGQLYLDPVGDMRAGVVLDNLTHSGERNHGGVLLPDALRWIWR